jgi:TonB-dependent receptor
MSIMTQRNSVRAALFAAVSLSGLALATSAAAQNAPAPAQAPAAEEPNQEIVITGYRASLQSSTNAKRDSTTFTDSIFAEDIGKFPDTNIAESFNRIPGITITRETNGDGQEISIRGLGTNFTKVLLNGAPVAVASTGRTDSQNTNREVDLDLFPTELFTSLTVHKSSSAEMIEGGAAGTVDMRSARPFDHKGDGFTVNYSGATTNNSNTDAWGFRGSMLGSYRSGDFGVLLGVAGVHAQTRVTGYETIGLTNPNLSATQSTSATRNSTGGGNWTIPGTVPANAGNGLNPGDTIDQAFLLAHNPGANITQIDNGLIPRLGRPSDEFGPRDRFNAIASFEYKSDSFHAYVDSMYGHKFNDLQRIDMDWVGRNGAAIPLNTTYDVSDCSNGCTVTKGTYANAQFFLEYRPFKETTDFWGVNPGFDAKLSDNLKLDGQMNYTMSKFHRESPTVLVITPASSGITVNYVNNGNLPSITTSGVDLNNPAAFGWAGGRVNIQDERRRTETKGGRANLTWGEDKLNLKFGVAYDDVSRRIDAYDNSQAWQNAVCGDNPSAFLLSPNTQPPCEGLATTAPPSTYPVYAAYGTGYTAGKTGPVTYAGSLIPQGSLANYLMPGPDGFITVNWPKFVADSKYNQFHDAAPAATSSNTSANAGFVGEKTWGTYAEVNGKSDIGDNRLDYNVGLRWVHTDQTIGGYVSIADPRNIDTSGNVCPKPGVTRDGSCYPNILNFVYTDSSYSNWLPSANAAFHIGDHTVLRGALSRTMTRANPNAMLPGLNFSSPSADTGSVGNPSLAPYISDNIDVGFEYYTGHEGYFGFAAFRKAVKGYTTTGQTTVPFSALAAYGVTYDTLTPTQQAAINSRGGPTQAQVTLSQQVNSTGTLKVDGLEFNWVQPLDFLIGRYLGPKGFGFTANLTLIGQSGSDAATSSATTGVAPVTYNLTFYYDHGGVSARISTTYTQGSVSSTPGQNGITAAALYTDNYQQWDFGGSLDLEKIIGTKGLPELTLDVINIGKEQQRSYFQFQNAAFTVYQPGRQVMIGLRGRF